MIILLLILCIGLIVIAFVLISIMEQKLLDATELGLAQGLVIKDHELRLVQIEAMYQMRKNL